MTFSSHLAPITVGLSIALLSTASMAETSSSNASVGNVQYHLIDLTPNDGIDTSLTLVSSYNHSYSQISDEVKGLPAAVQTKDATSYSPDYTYALVASSQSQSYSAANGGLFSGVSSKGYQGGDGFFQSTQNTNQTFSLSAHTAIVLTGYIGGGTKTSTNNFNTTNAFSNAVVSLRQVTPFDPDGTFDQAIGRSWFSPGGNQPGFESFAFTFNNNNDFAIDVKYAAWASSNGSVQSTTPVPEPETYAMMLSGLGMLAFLARRKAKQNAL